ncbi:hypothetical protein ACOMHN_011507 [Nucella lapillus]
MMEWRSISKIAALAVAFPSTVVLLYWLFIRRDDDGEEEEDQKSGNASTSRLTTIQLSVPSKFVGTVIGAKGANIKKIQEESGARVMFTDKDSADRGEGGEADRTVLIRGDSQSAQKAEVLIRQVMADMPTVVSELVYVPSYCLGRLIGRGGETVRNMSRTSKCTIVIDRTQESRGRENPPRKVTISGTHKDIQVAKGMIKQKVDEEEEFRLGRNDKRQNRDGQKSDGQKSVEMTQETAEKEEASPPKGATAKEPDSEVWCAGDQSRGAAKIPGAKPVAESMNVFVTAVENVGRFWIQMVTEEAINLENLTETMTSFYIHAQTSETYKLSAVNVGDVVASPFASDDSWYRARVEGFMEGKVDLFYLDFGDVGLLPLESLRELTPEFLSLPIQAIECKLASVEPIGERWSEESSDVFEELTHCAEWIVMSAVTVGYMPGSSPQKPCLQLVDDKTSPPLDIANTLVKRGLAQWEPSAKRATSDTEPATSDTPDSVTSPSSTVRTPELVPDPRPS